LLGCSARRPRFQRVSRSLYTLYFIRACSWAWPGGEDTGRLSSSPQARRGAPVRCNCKSKRAVAFRHGTRPQTRQKPQFHCAYGKPTASHEELPSRPCVTGVGFYRV